MSNRNRRYRKGLRAEVGFEPRDLWIGVFWDRTDFGTAMSRYDLYICLVPCVPLHLWWWVGHPVTF